MTDPAEDYRDETSEMTTTMTLERAYLIGHHNALVEMLRVFKGAIVCRALAMSNANELSSPTADGELSLVQRGQIHDLERLLETCESFLDTCDKGRAAHNLKKLGGFIEEAYLPVTGARIDAQAFELISLPVLST